MKLAKQGSQELVGGFLALLFSEDSPGKGELFHLAAKSYTVFHDRASCSFLFDPKY